MTAAHPQLPEPDYTVLPYRRAQVHFDEPQLRALLGLAPDESIVSVRYDIQRGGITTVVESPRLKPAGYEVGMGDGVEPAFQLAWNCQPPYIDLPLSKHYEPQADKSIPLMLLFRNPDGTGVSVALIHEDGILTPALSIMDLDLTADQAAEVDRVCAEHSRPQS